jgi:hypothetical protein
MITGNGFLPPETPGQFQPGAAIRDHHVRHQQIDPATVAFPDRCACEALSADSHLIAATAQGQDPQLPHLRIVFDQQDCLQGLSSFLAGGRPHPVLPPAGRPKGRLARGQDTSMILILWYGLFIISGLVPSCAVAPLIRGFRLDYGGQARPGIAWSTSDAEPWGVKKPLT